MKSSASRGDNNKIIAVKAFAVKLLSRSRITPKGKLSELIANTYLHSLMKRKTQKLLMPTMKFSSELSQILKNL